MNRDTGEKIGNQIGQFMEADVNEDGMAIGEYLRVKVRIEINKPLMRGTNIQIGDTGRTRWSPFEYEFLPEFCFTCGILGHDDKACEIQLAKGEVQRYGRWMKAFVPRHKNDGGKQLWSEPRSTWRNTNEKGPGSFTRSDSPSWRKEENNKITLASGGSNHAKTQSTGEVSSPPKANTGKEIVGTQRILEFNTQSKVNQNTEKEAGMSTPVLVKE
jgi:hypothetical protein